jgi:DNA-binding transcriptional regulator PaaX
MHIIGSLMQMNQYRKIATPEPALNSEILPLHFIQCQNDSK